jgi:hypothetical protein
MLGLYALVPQNLLRGIFSCEQGVYPHETCRYGLSIRRLREISLGRSKETYSNDSKPLVKSESCSTLLGQVVVRELAVLVGSRGVPIGDSRTTA